MVLVNMKANDAPNILLFLNTSVHIYRMNVYNYTIKYVPNIKVMIFIKI